MKPPINEPGFSAEQRIKIKSVEGIYPPVEEEIIGKKGTIAAYGGWYGSGATLPIRQVHHNYIVRIADDDSLHLVPEDCLELVE